MLTKPRRIAALTGVIPLFLALVQVASAQEVPRPVPPFRSLEDLNAHHDRQLVELDRRRLADLDTLASSKTGAEGESAYRELFLNAIARDLIAEATPAAERFLAGSSTAADVRALATLVTAVAESDHGRFDQALARFRSLVTDRKRTAANDPDPFLAAGETFLRHLIRTTRYDEARRLCVLLADESGEAEVSAHFGASLRPLKLVGSPAPAIDTTDVDGHRVRLADLKGKVVLVSFWTSWCPPCLEAFPGLNSLAKKYQGRGFEVLGVNLDAHHEEIRDLKTATPIVRRVLIHHGVTWPNVLNDDGTEGDIARAYGVESVPYNVLIGPDGTVLGVSIGEPELEAAVLKALALVGQTR